MDGKMVYKKGRKRETISLEDIIFMEKNQRKIHVHTKNDIISFYGRYGEVGRCLDERFTSPHRSYMLNMEHIVAITECRVVMITGHAIILCRPCMSKLKKTYDGYVAKNLANP